MTVTALNALLDTTTTACALVVLMCALLLVVDLRRRLVCLDGTCFQIELAAPPRSTESFFMSLHGLHRSGVRGRRGGQPWLGLELFGGRGRVGSAVWIPEGEQAVVSALLRGVAPDARLVPLERPRGRSHVVAGEFALTRGNHLSLRTVFDDEPLAALLAMLAHATADVSVQLLVRPKPSRWQTSAYGEAQRLRDARGGGWFPGAAASERATQFERDRARLIESKAASLGFDCVVRVLAAADSEGEARAAARAMAASLLPFTDANALSLRRTRSLEPSAPSYPARFPLRGSVLLTTKELAALWRPLDEATAARARPPGDRIPTGAERGERVIGVSEGGSRIGISVIDSRSHLHLLGATGTGKTTVLLNLAAQDIAAGRGLAVLDPKGDLVHGLLQRIPRSRTSDVVLISPQDTATSVGINPLELASGDDRDLVAENTLTIFKRIYERYWGPRTDDILRSALLTVMRGDRGTLAHVVALLTSEEYRAAMTAELHDPLGLGSFWTWFGELSDSQRREAIGPVLNKLRDVLVRPRLRRLLCQSTSTLDLRALVDGHKILLADLSVGRWGESAASLIGSFLVARIWQAVLARSGRAEAERSDFFLFLDEFQHFVGIAGPFADVLAEARSLRLSLTIANQHLGQLTRELREAVASNARSRIVFQCGQDDAAYLAREFAPLDGSALMSLGRFEAAARLAVSGRTSEPFRLRTVGLASARAVATAEDVRAASARSFGRPTQEIDAALVASLPHAAVPGRMKGGVRARPPSERAGRQVDAEVDGGLMSVNRLQGSSRASTSTPGRTTPPEEPTPV